MALPVSHKSALQANKLGPDEEGLQRSQWASDAGLVNLTLCKWMLAESKAVEDCIFPQQAPPSPVRRAFNKGTWVSSGANQLCAPPQDDPETEAKERTVTLGDQSR